MEEIYLSHHGIKGQRWGVRRYQNKDGSLTPKGRRRLERADKKWIKKHDKRVYRKTYNASKKEMKQFVKTELKGMDKVNRNGTINLRYANAYNRKLAEVMNRKVKDLRSPSGRVIRYVAKRGDIGVYTALASLGADMSKVKSGVYASGKVAYKKNNVGVIHS